MNFLDKAINFISPRWGLNRQYYREMTRNYDAGSSGRLNSGWIATNNTAENTDRSYRDIIRSRARDLERNSDVAESIINAFVRNVVGKGFRLQAKTDDENLNNEIEELFQEWSKAKNIDTTGQQNLQELCEMLVRRQKVDGGIIFVKCYTNDCLLPFQIQAKEVDELETSIYSISSANKVYGGIEYNDYNKPVKYYFKKYDASGFYTGEYEEIPADRVIFMWKKKRPTQIREMSELANTLPRVKEINEYNTAITLKEKIQACLSVFITKIQPSGGGRRSIIDKESGLGIKKLVPGMIQELAPGESVTAVNPSGQASNAEALINNQQRMAGAGQGISYEVHSRDMSKSNYSSARQGMLEDRKTFEPMQMKIIESFLDEIYDEFLKSAVLTKSLSIDLIEFLNNKRYYSKHKWITPGWSWIDPIKEANANRISLECGFDTLQNICGSRGEDWKEVIKQLSIEQDYMKQYNLTIKEKGGKK